MKRCRRNNTTHNITKHQISKCYKNLASQCLLEMFNSEDWTCINHPERLRLLCDVAGVEYNDVKAKLLTIKAEYFRRKEEERRKEYERKALRLGWLQRNH